MEKKPESIFINRELSWLDFDSRVLALAKEKSVPLVERVKFAAIFGSNMDEFFMVRVGSLYDQTLLKANKTDNVTHMTAAEQIAAITPRVAELQAKCDKYFQHLVAALAQAVVVVGVHHMDGGGIVDEVQGRESFQAGIASFGEDATAAPEGMIEGNGLDEGLCGTEAVAEVVEELGIVVELVKQLHGQLLRDAPPRTALIQFPLSAAHGEMHGLAVARETQQDACQNAQTHIAESRARHGVGLLLTCLYQVGVHAEALQDFPISLLLEPACDACIAPQGIVHAAEEEDAVEMAG